MATTSTARKTAAARKAAPTRKSPARRVARKAAPAAAPAAMPGDAPKARDAAAKPPKAERADKPGKLKLVRDSFTMTKLEYGVIDVLKTRASRLGRPAKKSDILRAGVKALEAMTDADFAGCMASLPPTKPAKP